ncbi:hypothetical protein Fleli_2252 [Bernardetia litoralis DSM 6794]|uniref:P pilus assembly/Cpx signaling pathway, periplasmic inhibitor/zinc-resistance associated protein n=1 Tax=Bernardetia litoralis (strain ATCC 23117 / DSM 6794 / NBRC 15988 / NCIMB 1366 / Fx l1 / Sio-4) TaxID=880071 RepID=I4AKZ4_BERLS|nr:hypothetical protein [Bernardetia litoralis]AFM04629.1 hypothetical protein Fleli_2252 [Bernardetia litoralis DSM 6794]
MKTQKNLMSKIALLSLLFFFVGMTTTFAQKRGGKGKGGDNGTPTEKAEKRSQKWKTEFSLNDTQTSELKTAIEKQITANDALKEEKSPETREKRKAIMTEFDAEVKAIFTTEQYSAYEKMTEEKKNNKGGKKGKRG